MEGKKRSRRLFSTLNRYARPVSKKDIIALDEDDAVAIVTRNLLEKFSLFQNERIVVIAGKAIPDSNKKAFTSIETLYQCNYLLLQRYLELNNSKKIKADTYIRFRPTDEEINSFENYCTLFWTDFIDEINVVKTFLQNTSETPAAIYRNRESGGNILFRPIGLLPFVNAAINISKRGDIDLKSSLRKLNRTNLDLDTPCVTLSRQVTPPTRLQNRMC